MKTLNYFGKMFLLTGLVFQTNLSQAQTYADSESNGVNGLCVGCHVANPHNAVSNDYENAHSTLNLTVSTLGAAVHQRLKFPVDASSGNHLHILIEDDASLPINATLLGGMNITTFNNGISNNDTKGANDISIELFPGSTSKYAIEMEFPQTFDEIEIKLNAGIAGALTKMRIYSALHHASDPLPIELIYFMGKNINGLNKLEWSTATETNNDYFTVEKSADAIRFEKIATIKGARNSTSALQYSFTDENPLTGINYYRLKQTDYDGKYEYFTIIAIDSKDVGINQLLIGSNPFRESLSLFYQSDKACTVELQIINMEGLRVYRSNIEFTEGPNIYVINELENLTNGFYTLCFKQNDKLVSHKIVKM